MLPVEQNLNYYYMNKEGLAKPGLLNIEERAVGKKKLIRMEWQRNIKRTAATLIECRFSQSPLVSSASVVQW